MLTCPHCTQKISPKMVSCPACRKPLKAFGHPGIPLHYAESSEYLCDRCLYHQDNTCTFPQRPYAKTCTLYQDVTAKLSQPDAVPKKPLKYWLNKYKGLLIIFGLVLLSVILTIIAN